jgi:uroporphyrinogen-III synthase
MVKNFNGKIIAITRPIERSQAAVNIVESKGATALVTPTLELKISRTDSLMNLCEMAHKLDWLIFTSPASVESIFRFCPEIGDKLNANCKIAVIGPKTKEILNDKGLEVDMVPSDYTAEGLLGAFKDYDIKGKIIGLPRTMVARKVLPDGLTSRGAEVFLADAYKSTIPHDKTSMECLINKIIDQEIDAITFTSPLTVKNLFEVAGKERESQIVEVLSEKKVLTAAIGPITGKTLEDYGIEAIIPPRYTVKDMMIALFDSMYINCSGAC